MPSIGIDLGTTCSCVGVWQNGKVDIIVNEHGGRTTPSCVAFTDMERLIGESAKRQIVMNPSNTIFEIKRLIGRKFDDTEVQEDLKYWPFQVINDKSKPKIRIEYQGEPIEFFPEEISAMVLSKMKSIAETYLGTEVKNAVITVPAYFNDSQRQATKDAGIIAGLNVMRIISEPTAAALAYGLDKNVQAEKKVLVFDLGGGTLDVSILSISRGALFEVLSTSGNTHLGGGDFDNRLVDYLKEEFRKKSDLDISDNPRALGRLRMAAEQAKRSLSSAMVTSIHVEALCAGIDFVNVISVSLFEDLCDDLFQALLAPIKDAISGAKLVKKAIDEVILVGGSTRIPKIRRLLQDYFEGKQLNCSVHPDEAVAYGATVKAAVLGGDLTNSALENVTLLDVTPLSLGIDVNGDIMSVLIERNTRIPCERTRSYGTSRDNQTVVNVKVYEGERLKASGNNLLGTFTLKDVPPARKGKMKLFVTFKLDEDGILSVTEKCLDSGSSAGLIVKNDEGRHSKRMIDKMIIEAVRFKEEDENHCKKIEARLKLEHYAYKVKHETAHVSENIPDSLRTKYHEESLQAIQWLEVNSKAQKEEYDYKLKNLKDLCSSHIK